MYRKEEKTPLFAYTSNKDIQEDVNTSDLWLLSEGDLDMDVFA